MGKKGRNSGSSPSPSSLKKTTKHPNVQNSSKSIDSLTPWERKVTEASKASRSNAKANEEAIKYAAGLLETSQVPSSSTTPTENVINDLVTVGLNTPEVVINEATPLVCALSGKGKKEMYALTSIDPSSTVEGVNLEVPRERSSTEQKLTPLNDHKYGATKVSNACMSQDQMAVDGTIHSGSNMGLQSKIPLVEGIQKSSSDLPKACNPHSEE